ncbi:hypothetical protein BgAZ_206100 [Babesia gibsoni]|uniref:Uncharacterized protein n=1 Tax=Babesia gibsoni TaxID=33632 RepID=A0AAD8PE12_BABGI|nr:hypothetical protein BgAZ_206100 [Babesia gibsoni]
MFPTKALRAASKVCDALVMFGTHAHRVPFVSHPGLSWRQTLIKNAGVMAVAQLLEMKSLVEHRAHFTQDDVNRMLEYDAALAEKAQVAVDHDLPISHYNLEYLDQPGFLETLLEEKKMNEGIADEVLKAPKGNYKQPASMAKSHLSGASTSWL